MSRASINAGLITASIEAGRAYTWNGPICPHCGRGYIGQHTCAIPDLQAQIDRLQARIDALRAADHV